MAGHEADNAYELDIKFVPWPYRFATLRFIVVWANFFAAAGALAAAFYLRVHGPAAHAHLLGLSSRYLIGSGLGLAGTWILVFLRFFRHRANAFVRLRIAERSKIWISYRRGLYDDHSGKKKWWNFDAGLAGFLLEPERGNAENEGQRHPNAVTAIKTLIAYIGYVRHFEPVGFRVAYLAEGKPERETYKVPAPRSNETDLNFYRGEVELVAFNRQRLPLTFYLSRLIVCALFAAILTFFMTLESPRAPLWFPSAIMASVLALWIWIAWLRNRLLQEFKYVIYYPKDRRLIWHRFVFNANNEVGSLTEPGPLHQFIEELWLMSRYTGTGIKVAGRSIRGHSSVPNVHTVWQVVHAVWARLLRHQH